jgi:hypothetical protein
MAEQGPSATFQHLEVPIHSLSANTMLRPPLGLENQLTSPKSLEDFVKKECLVRLWQNKVLLQHFNI